MTEAQRQWLDNNPHFGPIGPPRAVQFAEWGTLYGDGTYERMDNAPRGAPIRVGAGAVGVAMTQDSYEEMMTGFDRAFLDDKERSDG